MNSGCLLSKVLEHNLLPIIISLYSIMCMLEGVEIIYTVSKSIRFENIQCLYKTRLESVSHKNMLDVIARSSEVSCHLWLRCCQDFLGVNLRINEVTFFREDDWYIFWLYEIFQLQIFWIISSIPI